MCSQINFIDSVNRNRYILCGLFNTQLGRSPTKEGIAGSDRIRNRQTILTAVGRSQLGSNSEFKEKPICIYMRIFNGIYILCPNRIQSNSFFILCSQIGIRSTCNIFAGSSILILRPTVEDIAILGPAISTGHLHRLVILHGNIINVLALSNGTAIYVKMDGVADCFPLSRKGQIICRHGGRYISAPTDEGVAGLSGSSLGSNSRTILIGSDSFSPIYNPSDRVGINAVLCFQSDCTGNSNLVIGLISFTVGALPFGECVTFLFCSNRNSKFFTVFYRGRCFNLIVLNGYGITILGCSVGCGISCLTGNCNNFGRPLIKGVGVLSVSISTGICRCSGNSAVCHLTGLQFGTIFIYEFDGIAVLRCSVGCGISCLTGNCNNFGRPLIKGVGVLCGCCLCRCFTGVYRSRTVFPFTALQFSIIFIYELDSIAVNSVLCCQCKVAGNGNYSVFLIGLTIGAQPTCKGVTFLACCSRYGKCTIVAYISSSCRVTIFNGYSVIDSFPLCSQLQICIGIVAVSCLIGLTIGTKPARKGIAVLGRCRMQSQSLIVVLDLYTIVSAISTIQIVSNLVSVLYFRAQQVSADITRVRVRVTGFGTGFFRAGFTIVTNGDVRITAQSDVQVGVIYNTGVDGEGDGSQYQLCSGCK